MGIVKFGRNWVNCVFGGRICGYVFGVLARVRVAAGGGLTGFGLAGTCYWSGGDRSCLIFFQRRFAGSLARNHTTMRKRISRGPPFWMKGLWANSLYMAVLCAGVRRDGACRGFGRG